MANPVVETQEGKLKGKTQFDYKGDTFYSFLGIPYAKPPIGDLRFKAPVEPEGWQGVRDATKEAGGSLALYFHFQDKVMGSEDCLHLNVYTPQLPNAENSTLKPVMFWIHGGGFVFGPSGSEIYGPEFLMTGDVVLVTISYRLGVLGFLKLEDPTLGVPGNAGMKDMVMALKWVQRNIKNFGGDPSNVTIFGESAGSASVHGLILSPMSKGLFHRAIMQSGSILDSWVFGEGKAANVAKLLGKDTENEKDMLEFLKTLPAEKILEAQNKIPDDFNWNHIRPFGMVVEKTAGEPAFLPDDPLNIISSGNYNKVPIIVGYTSNESLAMHVYHKEILSALEKEKDYRNCIPHYLNIGKDTELASKIASKIEKNYAEFRDTDKSLKMASDIMTLRGTYLSIRSHLKNLGQPIYLYIFSADAEMNLLKALTKLNAAGASHIDDLGYLFKTRHVPVCKENSLEERIMQRMVKLWTTFAKTGNPNSAEYDPLVPVNWEPIRPQKMDCLDIGNELKFIRNPDLDRLKAWEEIDSLISGATK